MSSAIPSVDECLRRLKYVLTYLRKVSQKKKNEEALGALIRHYTSSCLPCILFRV